MNSLLISCVMMELLTIFRGLKRKFYGVVYGIFTWVFILLLLPETVPTVVSKLENNETVQRTIEGIASKSSGLLSMDNLGKMVLSGEGGLGLTGEGGLTGGLDLTGDGSLSGDIDLSEIESDPEKLQEYIQNSVGTEEQLEEYERTVLGIVDGTEDSSADSSSNSEVDQKKEESIEENGSEKEDSASSGRVKSKDKQETSDGTGLGKTDELSDSEADATGDLAGFIFRCFAVLVSYIILKIMASIIGALGKSVIQSKEKSSLDILGVFWGVIEGILYIYVVMTVISISQTTSIGQIMLALVVDSPILRFLYNTNFIEGIVTKLIFIA
ncbi:MAG: hypothetical protein K6G06_06505 [Butyrivibrio sp.]|nr:hypothetical protein [Butyrivibrio sp.]